MKKIIVKTIPKPPTPRFGLGEEVEETLFSDARVGVVDDIVWSYAYHLKGQPEDRWLQPDEVRKPRRRNGRDVKD